MKDNMEFAFNSQFAKRTLLSFFVVMLLFLTCILRVAVVATGNYAAVQSKQSSYTLNLSRLRGTIYDCNMIPITNSSIKTVAAVSPTPRAVVGISSLLKGDELEAVLERLKSGKPTNCEVPEKVDCEGIAYTEIYQHNSSDTPAIHIIGYTGNDGHGVSGLEKAYDDILYSDKSVGFSYSIDGRGNILDGVEAEIKNDKSIIANGVVSTLDVNLQCIAEKAAENIDKGSIVVCEAKTGKIRAMVSKPYYDCTKIAEYMNRDDSPLLNRAMLAYSVGSVFKPCVAAAALEKGNSDFTFNCTGSTTIVDRKFNCHKRDGHGLVDLKMGLAYSCNSFFYNFAISIGAESVYKMASSLGFSGKQIIADGLETAANNLPSRSSLENEAALANLSIGQGELLLSPVSMLTLYNSIATNGTYYTPSIVEGIIKNGRLTAYEGNKATRAMSSTTAQTLREYLAAVITEGTGKSAQPELCTAAGKTATAQTGKFENGVEICRGWFCGFFPVESPEYTVIVFEENSASGGSHSAPAFAEIADGITALTAVDK